MDSQGFEILFLVLLAGALFAAMMGFLSLVLQLVDPIRRRFSLLKPATRSGLPPISPVRSDQGEGRFPKGLSRWLPRHEESRKQTLERLHYAGFRSFDVLGRYHAIHQALMFLLPAAIFALSWAIPDLSGRTRLIMVLIAFLVGMIGPSYYLDRCVERRQQALRRAIPDMLDLLVVCTEAGLSLNGALQRVSREIASIHPEIAEELAWVDAEMRAGVERDRALRGLINRTGMVELKDLVGLLVQSLRFGTSIAATLRHYAIDFRDQRMQKAEEAAAKLSTKMIFPLIFCFMPSFFIVAVGPAVLRLAKLFSGP